MTSWSRVVYDAARLAFFVERVTAAALPSSSAIQPASCTRALALPVEPFPVRAVAPAGPVFPFAARSFSFCLAARSFSFCFAARSFSFCFAARSFSFCLAARSFSFCLAARSFSFCFAARSFSFCFAARSFSFCFAARSFSLAFAAFSRSSALAAFSRSFAFVSSFVVRFAVAVAMRSSWSQGRDHGCPTRARGPRSTTALAAASPPGTGEGAARAEPPCAPASPPVKVLTWHVHGSYLYYLSHVPVTWVLPVRPEGGEGYAGAHAGFPWGDNVVEMTLEEIAATDLDLVVTQSRANWATDRHDVLGGRVRDLPALHVEHDPPPGWPNDALHPVQDEGTLLVHVTPFNQLMWDNGITPNAVVDHGVVVPPDVPWTGSRASAITVVNNLHRRGRRLGPDVFDRVAAQVPVDLAGMNGEAYDRWLGDIKLKELHARLPEYRCFFNPIRYTSMGLAVCEAMMLGLPVVGLATTEMATAVQNGVSGWVETDPRKLAGHVQRLLDDRDEAAALSEGAKRLARERFGIERFVAEWLVLLEQARTLTA